MNAAPIYETEPTAQPEAQQQPEASWLDAHLIEVMFGAVIGAVLAGTGLVQLSHAIGGAAAIVVAVVAAVLAGLAWVGVSAQRISSAMRAK